MSEEIAIFATKPEIATGPPDTIQAVRRGTNPEMVRVAVAALKSCTKADRTAAIVAAIAELPVDLVKIVAAALDKGKPGQFATLFEAYGYAVPQESKGTRGGGR